MAEWKKAQDERTKAIKERKAEWELEKKQWAAEKAVAKAAKRRRTTRGRALIGRINPTLFG